MSANTARWRTIAIQSFWAALFYAFLAYFTEWRFAAILMAAIWVHEMGHLLTARAVGVATKGVYFIPMLGAVAPMAAAKTHKHGAWIAIMGPLAGGTVGIAMLILGFALRNPVVVGLAGMIALFNLFNMLPIAPLDGGRVATALLGSVSPKLEVAFGALCVGLSVLGMIYVSPIIFAFVGLAGYAEFRNAQRRIRRDEDRERIVASLAKQHGTAPTPETVTEALEQYCSSIRAADGAALLAALEANQPRAAEAAKRAGVTPAQAHGLYLGYPVIAAMNARKSHMPLLGGTAFHVTDDKELDLDAENVRASALGRFLAERPTTRMGWTGIAGFTLIYVGLSVLLLQATIIGMSIMPPGAVIRFFLLS